VEHAEPSGPEPAGRSWRSLLWRHRRTLVLASVLGVGLAIIGIARSNRPSVTVIDTISFGDHRTGAMIADPATQRLYTSDQDVPAIVVFDGATLERLGSIPTMGYHNGTALDPVTNRLYVTQQFGHAVKVIDGDTLTGTDLPVPEAVNALGALAVDPAGHRLFVSRDDNGDVAVFDTTTDAFLGAICPACCTPNCNDAWFDQTSGRLLLLNGQKREIIVTSGKGDVLKRVGLPAAGPFMAPNPRTGRLYVSMGPNNGVAVVDVKPGSPTVDTVVGTIALPGDQTDMAVDPDRNRVYVAHLNGFLSVIDGATDRPVATVPICPAANYLAVLPALGRVFASCTSEMDVLADRTPPRK
jgi:DNA-binding beta-propeller fold protein YncE